MRKAVLVIGIFIFSFGNLFSQIENIPTTHPVYDFLVRYETRGMLPHFSSSMLPLEKREIVSALKKIASHEADLSSNERAVLARYELEFGIGDNSPLVIFSGRTDSAEVFSRHFFENRSRFVYHFDDGNNNVALAPLASLTEIARSGGRSGSVLFGNLGFRLYGSLSNHFGYMLQATNGTIFAGEKSVALTDKHLSQSIKFTELKSDFDFTESDVRVAYDWFYASIGRQTRLWGSGIENRTYLSANAPVFATVDVGAKFSSFEYRFSTGGLLATYSDSVKVGFNAVVPQKYTAMHRFSVRPRWGEIGFWEGIVYSKRNIDVEYLNPLSFFKSVEHSLRDRDNSLMGMDGTLRLGRGIELKGTFIFDDIVFGQVGKHYWSNKYAWNLGAWYSPSIPLDFGAEYSRVEPYTFSHFDSLNTYTNDGRLLGSDLQPNSEEYSFIMRYWLHGGKYPLSLRMNIIRHGENEYNADGTLARNVGGDFNQTKRPQDSETVHFLDGRLRDTFSATLHYGFELFRDFSAGISYTLETTRNERSEHYFRIVFSYLDF